MLHREVMGGIRDYRERRHEEQLSRFCKTVLMGFGAMYASRYDRAIVTREDIGELEYGEHP